jgi:hypothetical protein
VGIRSRYVLIASDGLGWVFSSAAFGDYSKDCARPKVRCIHAFDTK